jgi:hypothetical protein
MTPPARACQCLINWYNHVYDQIQDNVYGRCDYENHHPYNEWFGFGYDTYGNARNLDDIFATYNPFEFQYTFLPRLRITHITQCDGGCDLSHWFRYLNKYTNDM